MVGWICFKRTAIGDARFIVSLLVKFQLHLLDFAPKTNHRIDLWASESIRNQF
jgi:hypothetical protein